MTPVASQHETNHSQETSHVSNIQKDASFIKASSGSPSGFTYSYSIPLELEDRIKMSQHPQNRELTWSKPLSIDLFLKVLNVTFLHPFVAWMIPLCLRAQATPWRHTSMQITLGYAAFLTLMFFLGVLNRQIAYSKPRKVDFSEEVIVITGGASGLGLLIAEVYGMRGATVAVLDVKELESGEARGVSVYNCDVADKDQVAKVAVEIERDLGTPTILINNAAVVNGKPLLDLSIDDIERTFRINLFSHFYTLKTFLPGMVRAGHGTIVTMSSVLGQIGAARLTDYAASKAAITAMHKSLVAELKPHPDIKTVLVSPGQMSTPLFGGMATPSSFFGPILEPVDVAKEIIAAIDAGSSANLAMPFYARWTDWMNVFPVGVHAIARKWSGIDTAMEGFKGRSDSNVSSTNSEKAVLI